MLKYHVNEQGLKSKLENMNWHSVIKKTRRVNQIILKSAGINTSVSVCLFVVVCCCCCCCCNIMTHTLHSDWLSEA